MAIARKVQPSRDVRELAQELWGLGWTCVRRHSDPFHIPPEIIPTGMRYEWANKNDFGRRASEGWCAVPFDRHDDVLAPVGQAGDAEVGGMILLELPKEQSTEEATRVARAHKNVDDWAKKYGQFSGGARVWTGDAFQPQPEFKVVGDPVIARTIIDTAPKVTAALPVTEMPKQEVAVPWHRALRFWLLDLFSTERKP